MSIQDQAAQMIHCLSDDNVIYLIDFMERFMLPDAERGHPTRKEELSAESVESIDFMAELENMRMRDKAYFPSDFDSRKAWKEGQ